MNKAGKIKKLLITSMSVKEIAEQVKCTPDYVYQLRIAQRKLAAVKTPPEKHNWINPPTANNVQVGGTHYKTQDIQPWDAIRSWNLCFFAGNAVKYIARHKSKGGVEDLRKARHYLDKLIELQVK
jgi:hypothetical protein